jgi:hypothetical protein
MNKAARDAELRRRQLDAILAALAEQDGQTAYMLGPHVPVPPPTIHAAVVSGVLAVSAPMTLVLNLLAELNLDGRVWCEPDQHGARWHLKQ